MRGPEQQVFRLTMDGDTLTNVEVQDAEGAWHQCPGYFFLADMLRAASDAILEHINEDMREDIEGAKETT